MRGVLFLSLLFAAGISFSQKIQIDHRASEQRAVVTSGGKPFTSFYYPGPDRIKKPVLYPVYSPGGKLVTRGWPLDPREGERVDHPHHIGIWFNYEDINGNDFWNNSIQVNRPEKRFGTILNTRVVRVKSGNIGELVSESDWVDHSGKQLIQDRTTMQFSEKDGVYLIDYSVTLNATEDASFRDVKDGMFAFRLARELELKYDKPETLTDENGVAMQEKTVSNGRVSGSYTNKEGARDDAVWGKSSVWCAMTGTINGEAVTVAIMDHPSNFGYPGYWHARGYGLFALNSVARQAYVKDSEPLNLRVLKGQSVTFRYRVAIGSKKLSAEQLNTLASEFARGR
jgi:hypothetical protein